MSQSQNSKSRRLSLLVILASIVFGFLPTALSESLTTNETRTSSSALSRSVLSQVPACDDVAYTPLGRPLLGADSELREGAAQSQLHFKARLNEPVYCLLDGVVKKAGWRDENLGISVEIHHSYPGLSTVVSHLGSCAVKQGDKISRGEVVGFAGQSSSSKGSKVSFFVIDGNKYIEPVMFLNQANRYAAMLNQARLHTSAANQVRDLEFADSTNIDLQNSNISSIVFKKWTADERQIISNLVSRLKYSATQFIGLSTTASGLKFARASTVTLVNNENCMAATCGETIVVSDKFFEETNQQLHCLTHELVHRADLYGFITYSKEWIAFAQPMISKFEGMSSEKLQGLWPSVYACENLNEALAEYAACYLEGQFFASKDSFDKSISPMIFHPDDSQLTWYRLLSQANTFMAKNQLKNADECLTKAISICPSQAMPFHYLAVSSARRADLKGTIGYTDKFLGALDKAGLAKENRARMKYVNVVVDNYLCNNRNSDLLELLDHLIIHFPADETLMKRRIQCLKQLK